MTTIPNIQVLFEQKNGIVPIQYLLEKGVSYYDIHKLLATERVTKLKRGLYKWVQTDTDEMVEVAHIIPKGIFCLQTACFYHELTTSIPNEFHLAIPDDQRIVLPDAPPIKIYYWNPKAYQLGQTWVPLGNQNVPIYDLEKTVCDTIRHRHKIGFDVFKEILKNYLHRKDRNLNRLNAYAKQLNCFNKVDDFIKILL